jgi:hypothetical protein
MADHKSEDFKSIMGQLENNLDEYLGKKAPQLPKEWRELLVKVAPYLAIIGVVLGVPGVLALLGLSTFVVPLGTISGMVSGRPFLGFGYLINVIFLGVMIVLEALSISPLFKRSKTGWNYMYYATLIGAIQNLISFNLGGLIIGTLLSLYLLFQVKEYYK